MGDQSLVSAIPVMNASNNNPVESQKGQDSGNYGQSSRDSHKKPIIILGETAARIVRVHLTDLPEDSLISVQTMTQALTYLQKGYASALVISRDGPVITEDELNRLTRIHRLYQPPILWPQDELLESYVRQLVASRRWTMEKAKEPHISNAEDLRVKNAELTARVASLEAAVRSLVAALSQCDPWPEAYAGEQETWEMIMQGIPVADLDTDDSFGDEQEFNPDDYDGEE